MKKINKIIATIFIPAAMIFTSCFDPIFYEIRQDVEPLSATVNGNIGQITRYTMTDGEYLFLAANNGLRYKKADNNEHGSWDDYPVPFDLPSYSFNDSELQGQHIIGVFANTNYLYLFTAEYTTTGKEGSTNPDKIHLYGKNNTKKDWQEILNEDINDSEYFSMYIKKSDKHYYSDFNVFQTNSPNKDHRSVYIFNEETDKLYKLTGLTKADITETAYTLYEDSLALYESSEYIRPRAVAYYDDEYIFFNAVAVATDETESSPAEKLYFSKGSKLYYQKTPTNPELKDIDCDKDIISIATTNDSVLIGLGNIASAKNGGIKRAVFDGGELKIADFPSGNNIQSKITTDHIPMVLLNATPDKTEEESSLYAALTFAGTSNAAYEDIGLWSYYPDRKKWNRE
ncbi:MAG: hypothetical protein J6X84_03160 [Treponema sp.]|nr:hypothetical protein [Treponema sp.]